MFTVTVKDQRPIMERRVDLYIMSIEEREEGELKKPNFFTGFLGLCSIHD